MDIKLPICDGIGAAARIHAERLTPIRVLAAFFQRDPVDKARDAGGYAYLVKPFTVVELRRRGEVDRVPGRGLPERPVRPVDGMADWQQDTAIDQWMLISQVAA